ncbi:MAG TPA: radical SAM protein [Candidatus Sulfotelmatobacter sp.]|nr:radical SAM protein [Candidatus Sulfotelmatobacter sp.]
MRILLLRPYPETAQFGLSPFFQTEPLGLMYLAAGLRSAGHSVQLADMRFERRGISQILRKWPPDLVAISCLHILEAPATLQLADQIKAHDPKIFVALGGHAISAFPKAVDGNRSVDAICIGEGETLLPALCDAVANGRALDALPSLLLPKGDGRFQATTVKPGRWLDLAQMPLPDRSVVARYQKRYCCLNYMPMWTMETARGCSYRCNFCSVWQLYKRTYRCHAPDQVRADFEATGRNLFMVDDLFWADRTRSEELGRTLLQSNERKNLLLVQTRADLVTENADLLKLWRPLAKSFDIFFGLESATSPGLNLLNKDADINKTVEAVRIARELGFGVTGNFIIDPDFTEADFQGLWDFMDEHQLYRVGFTILTPLPGTYYFEKSRSKIDVFDWSHYDLHHLLWQPRLPVDRFFELYCESWRHSVLNIAGKKKWWQWLKQVRLGDIPRLARILARTQTLMDPQAYLKQTHLLGPRKLTPVSESSDDTVILRGA